MTTNDENISTPESSGENQDQGATTSEAAEAASPVDKLAAERDQLRDQLLRTAADFDNFRKRTRKEIEDARARGRDDAIKDILPVIDNLERAVAAAASTQTIESVVEGVQMVLKLFEDTSERMGLKRVKAVGERFDPTLHEAIQQQETEDQPPGTILTEVVPGYMIGQRLLRAALVVVARKPSAKSADADASASGNGATSESSGSTTGNSA